MLKTLLEKRYEKKPALTQNLRATEASIQSAEQGSQILANAITYLARGTEQSATHHQANVLMRKSLRDLQRALTYLKMAHTEEIEKERLLQRRKK